MPNGGRKALRAFSCGCFFVIQLLAVLLLPRICFAQSTGVEGLQISFQSNKECASETQFKNRLGEMLHDWHGEMDATFNISVTSTTSPTIVMKVVNNTQTFVRRIRLKDCTHVSEVAALLVAITVDPLAIGNVSDPTVLAALTNESSSPPQSGDSARPGRKATSTDSEDVLNDANETNSPGTAGTDVDSPPDTDSTDNSKSNSPASEKTASPPPPTDGPQTAAPPSEYRIRHGISVWLHSTYLAAPKWSPGPAIGYTLNVVHFSFFADGRLAFAPPVGVANATGVTFRMTQISVHTGAEYQLQWRRWRLQPNMGIAMHCFISATTGLESNSHTGQWVFAPFSGISLQYVLRRMTGLFVSANIDWLTADTRYNVTEIGTIHTTGNIMLESGLGFFHFF